MIARRSSDLLADSRRSRTVANGRKFSVALVPGAEQVAGPWPATGEATAKDQLHAGRIVETAKPLPEMASAAYTRNRYPPGVVRSPAIRFQAAPDG